MCVVQVSWIRDCFRLSPSTLRTFRGKPPSRTSWNDHNPMWLFETTWSDLFFSFFLSKNWITFWTDISNRQIFQRCFNEHTYKIVFAQEIKSSENSRNRQNASHGENPDHRSKWFINNNKSKMIIWTELILNSFGSHHLLSLNESSDQNDFDSLSFNAKNGTLQFEFVHLYPFKYWRTWRTLAGFN